MRNSQVWIGTSWKMNKTIGEARDYATVLAGASIPAGVQPFLLPAHTSLAAVREVLPPGRGVLLGAQNAHWATEGAGTGEISMRMAADAGAQLIEMGHSERRASFGETDRTVARKARAALDHGLIPLVCVGEPGPARAAGLAETYVRTQIDGALSLLSEVEVGLVLIAYEPIWAIGEGSRPATAAEVSPVLAMIDRRVSELSGGLGCRALLYGGSVHQDNAASLLRAQHVDGLFVGRAAWAVAGFLDLLATAGRLAAEAVPH